MNTEKTIRYGLWGVGLYFAYRLFQLLSKNGGNVKDAFDKLLQFAAADAPPVVTGQLILPDGSQVPLANLYVDSNMNVNVNGRTYTVKYRDANGNYVAG